MTKNQSSYEAYCVRCRMNKTIKNAEQVVMKNGRDAIKGVCPDCDCGMYRIIPKKVRVDI